MLLKRGLGRGDRCSADLERLERDVSLLEPTTQRPYPRLDYGEAIDKLKELGSDIQFGEDFGGDDETMLTELYDRHHVDIVFNGHIHSYERTWPIRSGQAAAEGEGTIYMITGGGGGGLETPGPFRPFFQNNVRRGHHYSMVHINAGTLELKSFDLEGQLFDQMKLSK